MIQWPKMENSLFYLFKDATELRHLVLEANNISWRGKIFPFIKLCHDESEQFCILEKYKKSSMTAKYESLYLRRK